MNRLLDLVIHPQRKLGVFFVHTTYHLSTCRSHDFVWHLYTENNCANQFSDDAGQKSRGKFIRINLTKIIWKYKRYSCIFVSHNLKQIKMKKITFNEWTFTLSVLGFILFCYLSTNFSGNIFTTMLINVFATMILISLVITMLITKGISRRLKFIVYGFMLMVLVLSMSSCGTTKYGCPLTRSMSGY